MDFVGSCIQDGSRFRLSVKSENMAASTFMASDGTQMIVSRRLNDILHLPDETPALAHWHGERRTDAFRLTVGDLRRLAAEYGA